MSRPVTNDSEALQAFSDMVQEMPLVETKHIVGVALPLASYYGFRRGQGASVQLAFNFALRKYAEVLEGTIKEKVSTQKYSDNEIAILAGSCIDIAEENASRILNDQGIDWRVRRRDGQMVIRKKVSEIPVPNRANLTISNGIVIRVEMG